LAELPEKRAVTEAARIADFTWRDITLAFVRVDVAGRVRELNADVLAEEPALTDEPASPTDEPSA
jgi:hypothetical protein